MATTIQLNEIVDELIMESTDNDSYLADTSQKLIRFHVRNIYQQYVYSGKMSGYLHARELEIQDNWYVNLPDDFIRSVRVSTVTPCGKLLPLFIDETISSASTYLRDHNDELLLDDNDEPLLGSGTGVGAKSEQCNVKKFLYPISEDGFYNGYNFYRGVVYGGERNQRAGIKSRNGHYKLDKENGIIQVVGVPYDVIVLEYLADPIGYKNISDVGVDITFKEAIKAYAYHMIISKRRSVPINEKLRAEKEYRRLLTDARLKSTPSIQEWRQVSKRNHSGGAVKI